MDDSGDCVRRNISLHVGDSFSVVVGQINDCASQVMSGVCFRAAAHH